MPTTRVYAYQSAYINSATPDTNYSTGEDMLGGKSGEITSIVRFDVSSINKKKLISPCSISIYCGSPAYFEPAFFKCTKEWNEKTVTYNTRPYNSPYRVSGGLSPKANSWQTLTSGWVDRSEVTLSAIASLGLCITAEGSSASIFKSSRSTSLKPYADVTYTDVTPTVANLTPTSGFVNEKVPNTFSWKFGYDTMGVCGVLTQAEAKVEWRVFGSTTVNTITVTGATQHVTTAANTFPNGEIEWRVTVRSDDSIWSAPSAWYKLNTVDTAPTVTALTPTGETLNATTPIPFTWSYSNATGTPQQAFDLQVKLGDVWLDIAIRQTGSEGRFVAPAFSLPSGSLTWRIRAYNTDNVPGPWSNELQFTTFGVLNKPVIGEITTTARPTIHWTGTEQQLWELKVQQGDIVAYETGYMTGLNTSSYRLPVFLEDGSYTAKMRIRDVFGVWSGWAEKAFAVTTTKPTKPTIQVVANCNYGVKLTAPNNTYIYRQEQSGQWLMLGQVQNNSFIDYTTASEIPCNYKARAVNQAADSFCDSSVVSGSCTIRYTVLTLGNENLELKLRSGGGSGRGYLYSTEKALTQFSGRSFPCAEKSGYKQQSVYLSYLIRHEEFPLLLKMAEAPVILYRARGGAKLWGTIGELSCNEVFMGYEVSFDIRQVDYMEGLLC